MKKKKNKNDRKKLLKMVMFFREWWAGVQVAEIGFNKELYFDMEFMTWMCLKKEGSKVRELTFDFVHGPLVGPLDPGHFATAYLACKAGIDLEELLAETGQAFNVRPAHIMITHKPENTSAPTEQPSGSSEPLN